MAYLHRISIFTNLAITVFVLAATLLAVPYVLYHAKNRHRSVCSRRDLYAVFSVAFLTIAVGAYAIHVILATCPVFAHGVVPGFQSLFSPTSFVSR
jgi:hypothetical protein